MTINMVHYQTMIMLNIHEAKTQLSRYLRGLKRGQRIVLCRRNVPVAEIVPFEGGAGRDMKPRPIGLAAGEFQVPATFFEPLPEDILAGFGEPADPSGPEAAS
jgi:antitoxin (DNA-binding transcriptional repressor) of toxin-antitoxin stability system